MEKLNARPSRLTCNENFAKFQAISMAENDSWLDGLSFWPCFSTQKLMLYLLSHHIGIKMLANHAPWCGCGVCGVSGVGVRCTIQREKKSEAGTVQW